jgi:hypothetical protein
MGIVVHMARRAQYTPLRSFTMCMFGEFYKKQDHQQIAAHLAHTMAMVLQELPTADVPYQKAVLEDMATVLRQYELHYPLGNTL